MRVTRSFLKLLHHNLTALNKVKRSKGWQ